MKAHNFNIYFFFLILSGVGVLMFFILQPFLTAILAAAILAALFQGWYRSFLRRTNQSPHASAVLTMLLVAVIIIVPLVAVFGLALNEANGAYDRVIAGDTSQTLSFGTVINAVQKLPYANLWFSGQSFDAEHIANTIKGFSQNIFGFVQALYESVAHFFFWLFVMFFALFYFLIDGKNMVAYAMHIMPLRDEHERLLIDKFVSMSRATLRGTMMVGVVQGFLGGVMFAIASVPSPVIWGLIMTVMSVIPVIGVGIVWLPIGLILLLTGNVWQGVFVIIFGFAVISTIDNFLRPKLVGRDTQMHPLMIFFATLGGLSFFGFSGFIIGPIIASLALALLDIYALEFKDQLKSYNE